MTIFFCKHVTTFEKLINVVAMNWIFYCTSKHVCNSPLLNTASNCHLLFTTTNNKNDTWFKRGINIIDLGACVFVQINLANKLHYSLTHTSTFPNCLRDFHFICKWHLELKIASIIFHLQYLLEKGYMIERGMTFLDWFNIYSIQSFPKLMCI